MSKDLYDTHREITSEADAMFGDPEVAPPVTEESPGHVLDEFRAASMSAPAFTPEKASNLGGPRERVTPAMPAAVVTVGARTIDPNAPDPRDPFAHLDLRMNPAPSNEDRQRDARKLADDEEHESPYLSMGLLLMVVGLLVMLVWMFGARAFG